MARLSAFITIILTATHLVLATKLSASGLAVSNLTASTHFYQSMFGFRLYRSLSLAQFDENILTLPDSAAEGAALVLMQYKPARNVTHTPGKLVFNVQSVRETTERFRSVVGSRGVVAEEGSVVVQSVRWPIALVRDLDWHLVELNPIGFTVP